MIDKPFALVPIVGDATEHWKIGAAIANEQGYNATTWQTFDTRDQAAQFCEMMNTRMGLTDRQADLIIISTMGGRKYSEEAVHPDPYVCPGCGGSDTEAVGEQDDDPHQERMECNTCAATWIAVYLYAGITDFKEV